MWAALFQQLTGDANVSVCPSVSCRPLPGDKETTAAASNLNQFVCFYFSKFVRWVVFYSVLFIVYSLVLMSVLLLFMVILLWHLHTPPHPPTPDCHLSGELHLWFCGERKKRLWHQLFEWLGMGGGSVWHHAASTVPQHHSGFHGNRL